LITICLHVIEKLEQFAQPCCAHENPRARHPRLFGTGAGFVLMRASSEEIIPIGVHGPARRVAELVQLSS
jgi:hypothetical protein